MLHKYLAINTIRFGARRTLRQAFKRIPVATPRGSGNMTRPAAWCALVRAGYYSRVIVYHAAGVMVQISGRLTSRRGAARATTIARSLRSKGRTQLHG